MIEIIPAIMPLSRDDLERKASLVAGLASVVQIDVMDGIFVPSRTWPHDSPDSMTDKGKEQDDRKPLPFAGELSYEIDLMVIEPVQHIQFWMRPEVRRLIVHIESVESFGRAMREIRECDERERGGAAPREIGMALNMTTPLDILSPFVQSVDFVQCMGIAAIGYQGHPFDERVLDHVSGLRATHPTCIISVDGGVSLATAPRLIAAGANRLVSGSAIFESGDVAAALDKFKHL